MNTCKAARNLLARREAESLPGKDHAFLESHLAGCPHCRGLAERFDNVTGGLVSVRNLNITPRPEARQRFLARLGERRVTKRPSRRISTARSRRISSTMFAARRNRTARVLFWCGSAAAVLLAAGIWLAAAHRTDSEPTTTPATPVVTHNPGQPPPAAIARLELAGGRVLLDRGNGGMSVSEGAGIFPGDSLATADGSRAIIRYADGSSVELNRRTAVSFGEPSRGKRLTLLRGDAFVQATKQPADRPMVLNPDRSDQVSVMGTAFELSRHEGNTALRMTEGRVSFGLGEAAVSVDAGQTTSVRGSERPSAPVVVLPAEVASWRLAAKPVQEPTVPLEAAKPPAVSPPAGGGPATEPPIVTGKPSDETVGVVKPPEPKDSDKGDKKKEETGKPADADQGKTGKEDKPDKDDKQPKEPPAKGPDDKDNDPKGSEQKPTPPKTGGNSGGGKGGGGNKGGKPPSK